MSEYFLPEEFIDFVSTNELDDENYLDQLQYRSLEVVPDFSDHFTRSSIDIPYEAPTFRSSTSADNSLLCAMQPMILNRTHFVIESAKANGICGGLDVFGRFRTMTRTITAYLSCFNEYDFSFVTPEYGSPMWKGKYLQGSVSCEIDLNIYTGDSPDAFIIEASKMKGDAKPFHAFYREFKSVVTNTPEVVRGSPFNCSSLPGTQSKEQFLHAVRCIFNMATAEYFDSRLEATKMLCDLLSQPHNQHLQIPEFASACVEHLEALLVDDFDDVRQFAIIAFTSLKDIPGYKVKLVKSRALPLIFSMVEYVPEPMYETIQVRRECACFLAALAQFDARAVIDNLQSTGNGKNFLQGWKLENLACDSTLHNYAAKARDSLLKVSVEKK
jgi:hypothetical protein